MQYSCPRVRVLIAPIPLHDGSPSSLCNQGELPSHQQRPRPHSWIDQRRHFAYECVTTLPHGRHPLYCQYQPALTHRWRKEVSPCAPHVLRTSLCAGCAVGHVACSLRAQAHALVRVVNSAVQVEQCALRHGVPKSKPRVYKSPSEAAVPTAEPCGVPLPPCLNEEEERMDSTACSKRLHNQDSGNDDEGLLKQLANASDPEQPEDGRTVWLPGTFLIRTPHTLPSRRTPKEVPAPAWPYFAWCNGCLLLPRGLLRAHSRLGHCQDSGPPSPVPPAGPQIDQEGFQTVLTKAAQRRARDVTSAALPADPAVVGTVLYRPSAAGFRSSPLLYLAQALSSIQRSILISMTGAFYTTRTLSLQIIANTPPLKRTIYFIFA
ncbi:hypothetical protein HPB50_018798 [Hyalomma asiaticum]|uniref:Uncharacterized protein n=1 Tax=Hyalomma asiaticum TaxID=266040 RepID=A0ACB7RXU1_HYAAI|nr:hypothetical protein HPB50_018798 [Hyalomma asiaticum]